MEIVNRKARHEYIVIEDFVAGLVLQGSEVKSIRAGKCNISDAYCYISSKGEVWLKNSHIAKYDSDRFTNHDELRERKLLLTKKEIRKLTNEVKNPGITLIPLKIFVDDHGLLKLVLGLCKGKKEYDKRESIKERDSKRELDRIKKNF
jgi:SsrA-binding protein